ncbi:MAG: hemolysin family protein [Rhabdochlamydiaceae bacterium]|nr:hemolysin family protein [Rhabdochlamydiaceae bacterium]
MLIPLEKILYSTLYLLPAAIVSGLSIALQALGKIRGKEEIQDPTRFPLFKLFDWRYPKRIWESILFTLYISKLVYYLIFGFVSFYFLFLYEASGSNSTQTTNQLSFYASSILEISLIVGISLLLEFLLSLLIEKAPEIAVRFLSLPASLLMVPYLPLMFLYFEGKYFLQKEKPFSAQKLPFKLQEKLLEYLEESELNQYLDKNEKKLIHTVISFKDRIAREVMVPRIDVFSISSETSILEAGRHFSLEGYSRIPVYKDNVDKIIGVLLYKDILGLYTKHIESKLPLEALHKTVEHFVKPVLYTPETKKIAGLLQEFRSKQIHLAIVVDEYGGTEGIVTIEDVLEELVGNIEDEYDTQEEKSFFALASGGWIVDAKMTILDIEEQLGIPIPTHAEYDTIGGYIFHRAGSIPSKGWKIHLDEVDLEVIKSDERSVQKVKITQKNLKNKRS